MSGREFPDRKRALENDHVRLLPTDFERDVGQLYAAASFKTNQADIFFYSLGTGPFHHERDFQTYLREKLRPAYRRLEWKCNNENEPSKVAARRLGFRFEGVFRQHYLDKGRNRDTAWYSILDSEWPTVKHKLRPIWS